MKTTPCVLGIYKAVFAQNYYMVNNIDMKKVEKWGD